MNIIAVLINILVIIAAILSMKGYTKKFNYIILIYSNIIMGTLFVYRADMKTILGDISHQFEFIFFIHMIVVTIIHWLCFILSNNSRISQVICLISYTICWIICLIFKSQDKNTKKSDLPIIFSAVIMLYISSSALVVMLRYIMDLQVNLIKQTA